MLSYLGSPVHMLVDASFVNACGRLMDKPCSLPNGPLGLNQKNLSYLQFWSVPLQFFNRDALKEIVGLVGHPLDIHPSTENLTNIEVAKVYTVIDPRKPLPEAVNAQFESGEVVRFTVSSPWLPSLCSHCLKVGHTISKCPNAPPKCDICGSVKHNSSSCTRICVGLRKDKAPISSQLPIVDNPMKHQADGNIRKSSANKSLTSRKESHDVVRTQTPAKSLNLATDVETNVATDVSSSAVGVSPAVTIQKDHTTQKQLHNSLAGPSRQNDLVVVDLDSAGFISSEISAKGSDTASASGSESLSDEDYHSPEEVDRFIQVMTRQMRKRSKGKARARGPLNL